jgi:hypothetical protein
MVRTQVETFLLRCALTLRKQLSIDFFSLNSYLIENTSMRYELRLKK